VLQYQFAMTTGSTPPPILAGPGGGVYARSGASTPNTLLSGTLRSTSSFIVAQSLRPSLIGYSTDREGTVQALTASPLTGVRMTPLAGEQADAEAPGAALFSGLESSSRGVRGILNTSAAIARVQSRAATGVEDAEAAKSENPFFRALIDETESEEAGAQRASLLNRLRRRLRGELRDDEVDPLAPVTPPGSEPGDEAPAPEEDDDSDGMWEQLGPLLGEIDPNLVRILRQTRVPVERLSTDSVVYAEAYRLHMNAGQSLLADGRYFDAEDRFVRALSAAPGDVMAAVGRIHAQVGAGLYLSAAVNLRKVLVAHPEVVTAEYDPGLLPAPDRTLVIIENLREQASDEAGIGEDAALLLAYVGHHAGDDVSMGEGGVTRALSVASPEQVLEDSAGELLEVLAAFVQEQLDVNVGLGLADGASGSQGDECRAIKARNAPGD
jgi:hypothetical protein